jgi:cbb3-type cytochrome oxidase subunit 3
MMKLADAVGAAGLSFYPEVALVLFLVAFLAVVTQVASKRRKTEWQEASLLPLLETDAESAPSDTDSEREVSRP